MKIISDLNILFKNSDKLTIFKLFIKIILAKFNIKNINFGKLKINSPGRYFDDWDILRVTNNLKDFNAISNLKKGDILEIGPGKDITLAILITIFGGGKIDFIEPNKNFWINQKKLFRIIFDNYGIKCKTQFKFYKNIIDVKEKKYKFIYSWTCFQHINFMHLKETLKIMKNILLKNGIILLHIRWTDHFSKNKDEFNQYIFGRHFDNYRFFLNSGFYTNRVPKKEFELMLQKFNLKIVSQKNIFIEHNSFKYSTVSDFEFKKEAITPYIRSTTYKITHN